MNVVWDHHDIIYLKEIFFKLFFNRKNTHTLIFPQGPVVSTEWHLVWQMCHTRIKYETVGMCKSCKTCSNAVKNEFESHDNANVDKKMAKIC